MRFHAILFVRDEEDIIGECLDHNSRWCDRIYVFDTGSTDQTWEIVRQRASVLKQVVPVRREAVWWHDGLRAMVFQEFRSQSDEGDWWVRLDADEFYHVSPREFVTGLHPWESSIFHAYYNFRLTVEEASVLDEPRSLQAERERSIADRRRHYTTEFAIVEPRFFRYRRTMKWSPRAFAPSNAGFAARARIPIRHYPHRDPVQMERRFRLRQSMLSEMRKMDPNYAVHWNRPWRTDLIAAEDPRIHLWNPPEKDLIPCMSTNHLPSLSKRIAQFAAHSFLLPILDRSRAAYPIGFRPVSLPENVQGDLHLEEMAANFSAARDVAHERTKSECGISAGAQGSL